MKKVVYSITKLGRNQTKITGVGYIAEDQLIVAATSSYGKPYVKCYDCVRYCNKITDTEDEFKGSYSEIVEIEGRDVEIHYNVWFKTVK